MSGHCQNLVKLMTCKARFSPFFDRATPKSSKECTNLNIISENDGCSTYQEGDWSLEICEGQKSTIIRNNVAIEGKRYDLSLDSNCFIAFKDSVTKKSLIGEMDVCDIDSVEYSGEDFPISELTFHPCTGGYSGKFEDLAALRILKKGLLQMLPDFIDSDAKKDMVKIKVPTWEILWFMDWGPVEIDELQ